ncbi:hypothetical protein [Microvirga sp. 2TAF3]|uniref:hypothetical protein n=1 Tax=Microvirga sp. 2TAF3 TaxID=3233014 RepID=UPI003F9656E2
MKRIAFGAVLVLLSTTAYAQTSTGSNTSLTTQTSSGSPTMTLNHRSGAQGSPVRTDTHVRTRVESGARIGVEARERSGVSVRSTRTVREVEEPSVSVTHRRMVTTYDEPTTEVHRTVVKNKPSIKKVVVKKRKPSTKVVVSKRRHYVVDEPVEVRRRTVRRYEIDEPNVSVTRRTTVHQTRDVSPSVGVSVERHRTSVRPSGDVNVSTTTRQRSSSPEATGSVTTRTQMNASGNIRGGSSGSTNLRLQQQGGASVSGTTGQ